jgi:cytochrome c oxidase subunit III
LTLSTSTFGTTFFVLTGFHGTHVALGVVWLLSVAMLAHRGVITQERSLDVEIAGLYWHFVDIVWIVIFTVVYLIPTPVLRPGGH